MTANFNYQGAKDAGYSDEEINAFLQKQSRAPQSSIKPIQKGFDREAALASGYSEQEIDQFLKSKRTPLEKTGRVAGQYGVAAVESALLPYEIAVAPEAMKQTQLARFRENLFADIETLAEQKATGVWSAEDEKLYNDLVAQADNPQLSEKYLQTAELGVRPTVEKATGIDLKPEGIAERAANWLGYLRKPSNVLNLAKSGAKATEIIKNISPSGTDVMRSLGAGAALEAAEANDLGPIGTMTAAVVGDLIGGGIPALGKAALQPRKTLAKAAASFTKKDKLDLQKQLVKDFQEAGIQADIGTLTDSNLLKMMQTRLSQSGLTGDELDKFRKQLSEQIINEYKNVSKGLGESIFESRREASEIGKEMLSELRNTSKAEYDAIYAKARESAKNAQVNPLMLAKKVSEIEKAIAPGAVKSAEQQKVLGELQKLKQDIYKTDPKTGKLTTQLKPANVEALINNKIALNDIINFESQGGQLKLLQGLTKEIDNVLNTVKDPTFSKNWSQANKLFSQHAKEFRSKPINKILIGKDPDAVFMQMNTVEGIRNLEKVLSKTPEGKRVMNGLKRLKLQEVIDNKMKDNVQEQVKNGTFANLLKSPKDKEVIKEILGKDAFARLTRLQKLSGKLAQSAEKFLNASKSGVTVVDVGLIGKVMKDVSQALAGNPWPFAKTAAGFTGARYISKLMADPTFLKQVEQAILAAEKNDLALMNKIAQEMLPAVKAAAMEEGLSEKSGVAESA